MAEVISRSSTAAVAAEAPVLHTLLGERRNATLWASKGVGGLARDALDGASNSNGELDGGGDERGRGAIDGTPNSDGAGDRGEGSDGGRGDCIIFTSATLGDGRENT